MKHRTSKKNGKLFPLIAAIVLLCTLASCSMGGDDDSSTIPTNPTDTITTTDPTEATTPITEVSTEAPTKAPTETPTEAPTDPPATETEGITYILNTNTHKFHYQSCSSVDDMKESNKSSHTGTRDEVIAMGYEPCGRCDP